MKAMRLLILLVPVLLAFGSIEAVAVPANPAPIETIQPDGSTITVRIFGDEWYHFYESEDGYAIVQDKDDWWVYADLDGFGEYEPTQYAVGANDVGNVSFRETVGKHLREYNEEKINRRDIFYDRTMPGILESALEEFKGGTKLAINVPVILIRYTDFLATQTPASFTNMMNQTNYNGTGSFQDYYNQISYNNLTVTATVVGWYTAPNNRAYYQYGTGSIYEFNRARALARSAVDAAQTGGITWSNFDNDANGDVDVTFIVHQGPGAECGNTGYVWSHAWFLNAGGSNLSVTYGSKLIDRYIMQPELNCSGGHVDIGVFCHEFGHALGLPDLYDVDGSSEGVGNYCLMSSGSWGGNGTTPQTPVHMSAWCKIQNGWITPTLVASNTTGTSIPAVETTPTVFKLWTNGVAGLQYFLVENRMQTGFDTNLPTSGLAIWHIDENMRTTNNTDNKNENHKLVDLEEADGLAHLDLKTNRGDAGDLFPGATSNTTFDGTSNPNSNDYAAAATQVCVQNISGSAGIRYADFCVGTGSTGPNLLIRDCAADIGAEPSNQCMHNWFTSLDIWIDNNDDGVMDAPIIGQNNHLYIRSWNLGAATTNANIQCWFVNPSLGLNFGMGSPGTQIIDSVTGLSTVTVPSMATLAPTVGGAGYRSYFNWVIPAPPANIHHYCIGCAIANASDPQISPIPPLDNNLAQINFFAFAMKAGQTPAKTQSKEGESIHRQEIRIFNRFEVESEFMVTAELSDPSWEVMPGGELIVPIIPPGGETTIEFDVIKIEPSHRDTVEVTFKLFKIPEMEPVGGIKAGIAIDDLPPLPVGEWKPEFFKPEGDNLFRPMPTGVLSWEENPFDVGGFPERIRFYEVFAAPDPAQAEAQDPMFKIAETHSDDDLARPGFQMYIYEETEPPLFYTVVPVDMADSRGAPAPAMELMLPDVSPVPEADAVTRVSQNYPNPFNPQTSVDFTLTRGERVRITVYDSAGRLVKELVDQPYVPGTHSVTWNGTNDRGHEMASGVYFMNVQSASLNESKKMTMVR